jgi:phage terminase small subunit
MLPTMEDAASRPTAPTTAILEHNPAKPKAKRIRLPKLTGQQRDFVYEYLKTWNASKAARRAGYSPGTCDVQGSKLLSNQRIQAALIPMMRSLHLTPDRVMADLGAVAGTDISDFLALDEEGKPTLDFDPEKVAANGHLVKSLERNKYGYKLELHDRHKALELMARILRMTGDQPTSQVNIQFNVNVGGDSV